MITLTIDNREHALARALTDLGAVFTTEPLPVADILIRRDDVPIVAFERKTTADLVASIKDGRYNEQSTRLTTYDIPKHNIAYIIEGTIAAAGQMVYSALTSIWLYKGFSVLTTTNVKATARLILGILKKIEVNDKKNKPVAAADQPTNAVVEAFAVKQRKADNFTPEVFAHVVLCQVPGVSLKGAEALMAHFGSLNAVLQAAREGVEFEAVRVGGRKMSKSAVANLRRYLTES